MEFNSLINESEVAGENKKARNIPVSSGRQDMAHVVECRQPDRWSAGSSPGSQMGR